MEYKMINIPEHVAEVESLGKLCVIEGGGQIPYEVKRLYCTYGAKQGTIRGGHAHKTLRQLLFCTYGSIKIELDNGLETSCIVLDSPTKGLLLEAGIWHKMTWLADNSVLMVLASQHYNESDYIRNYDEFIRFAASQQ